MTPREVAAIDDPRVHHSLAHWLIGEEIGSGVYRRVYQNAANPEEVIKVERLDHQSPGFANVLEWTAWQEFKHSKLARFFVPCKSISPDGVILVQSKIRKLTPDEQKKLKHLTLPGFMSDVHRNNIGMYEGRIVLCDYGNYRLEGKLKKYKLNPYYDS